MDVSSLSRGPRTLLVGVSLIGVYLGYAFLTRPFLVVDRTQSRIAIVSDSPESRPERSSILADSAARWFPEDPWVADSSGRFRDGGRMLFFQDHELFNDARSIRVKPIAMLFQDSRGREPIRATAASAQLDASSRFSFDEGQFGRITSGLLSGSVLITGPDGLRIEGRTFYISDEALKVWTGQPVKFAWGTHSGTASGGAEIELLASGETSEEGLMSVSDVQRIRLLGRIDCDLHFPARSRRQPASNLHVTAANGFEYFVPTSEATFSGFLDRELRRDNQVLVERQQPSGPPDRLLCSQLVLQLQPEIQPASAPDSSPSLRLASIRAEGRLVVFESIVDGVFATMTELRYRLEERLFELSGRPATSSSPARNVEIEHNGHRLSVPRLVIAHDEANEVRSVESTGPGEIGAPRRSRSLRPEDAIDAVWSQRLQIVRGERTQITLEGDVTLEQPVSGLSLSGAAVDLRSKPADGNVALTAVESDSGKLPSDNSSSRLVPEVLVAHGNVRMTADDLSAVARDQLTVKFVPRGAVSNGGAADEESDRIPGAGATKTQDGARGRTAGLNGQTVCSSDTIETAVLLVPHDAAVTADSAIRTASASSSISNVTGEPAQSGSPSRRARTEFSDVWMKGSVTVEHTSASPGQSFTAAGNVLHAKEGFHGQREISLFGDPAVVENDDNRFEMQRIDLTEIGKSTGPQREVSGEGSGRVRFVVTTGLDGQPLDRPAPLDIYWSERMSFSGRTAHFVGSIRARLDNKTDIDLQLTCASLKVHFTDAIRLERNGLADEYRAARGDGSSGGEIERIECDGRVVVTIDQMKDGVPTARHRAEFFDLVFSRQTGDFRASGPGLLQSVQPDNSQQLASPGRVVASANTPVRTTEAAFVFLRAHFIGELTGNATSRFTRLTQHVRAVFGPVATLDSTLNADGRDLRDLPDKTGLLSCENLSVSEIPGTESGTTSFSLVAESNPSGVASGTRSPCRLESTQFSADADKITYDHTKQQFVVRADESRQARVTHRPDNGEPQNLTGRSFLYNRSSNQLTANQITGVQATEAP